MTVLIVSALTCDHKDKPWSLPCYSNAKQVGGISSSLMRLFARQEGWVQFENRDYCPEHAPLHPTHGTVTEELLANGHFTCVACGKIHGSCTGEVCPCGEPFTYPNKREVCR